MSNSEKPKPDEMFIEMDHEVEEHVLPQPIFGSETNRRPNETMTEWSRRLINRDEDIQSRLGSRTRLERTRTQGDVG